MADIGTAYVRIAPNMTGIQGKIADGMKGAGTQATKQLGDEIDNGSGGFQAALGKLGGLAKAGGVAIVGGLAAGAAGIGAMLGKMLVGGGELEQQLGGAEAVFGEFADSIKQKAESSYFEMGLSQNEFLQGANKMGALFQGAGFDVKSSMEMSADAIQRATDVASIMGIDTATALESVTGMAKGNFEMMDNLGVAVNDTAIQAYALSKGITKSTQAMSTQEKVGLATQMFMEKTAKYAGNYKKENQSLAGSINSTKKAFDDLMAGSGEIDGFIELAINTIELAVPRIVQLLPKIVTGISQVFTALGPAIGAALPTLVPAIVAAAISLFQEVVKLLPTVVQVLVQALPMFIKGFVDIFIGIVNALPQIISVLVAAIPTIVNTIVTALTSPPQLTAIIMGAIMLFLAILQAIPVIITALVGAIPQIVKNIIQTFTSSQFISAMMNAGVQLLQAVISGIWKMQGAVLSAAWEIVKTIGSALSPGNLTRIGGDVVRGIWDGINSMGGWLKDKVVSFVKDKIPGPIKQALGIHSPSKVAAGLGKEVPAGLAQGMDKNAGLVANSATNVANQAIAGMVSSDLSTNISATASVSPALSSAAAGGGNTTSNQYFFDKLVLDSEGAVKEFLRQTNMDMENVSMGITPNQGAY